MLVVFFTLGLPGEVRSITHWGVGGDSDGDPCAIVYVAELVEQGSKETRSMDPRDLGTLLSALAAASCG